jgi:hypothetical protein
LTRVGIYNCRWHFRKEFANAGKKGLQSGKGKKGNKRLDSSEMMKNTIQFFSNRLINLG